ncbi:MAG TPA: TMEM175 family protein [Thermoleophilaceae bacterium]
MSKGRLEAFSDGVFAIAITLLVLEIPVPPTEEGKSLAHALLDRWPSYAGFVISFVTIGIIWVNHHAVIARVQSVDRTLLFKNLLLLLTVSFIPFPTAVMAEFLRSANGQDVAVAFYSASFCVMGIAFRQLWTPAARNWVSRIGPTMYLIAAGVAFLNAYVALGICAGLALYYSLPISIEQQLSQSSS